MNETPETLRLDGRRREPRSPFVVLALDVASERSTGALRLVAAVGTILCAVVVAVSSPPMVAWVVIGAGAIAVVFWLRSWARARNTVGDAARHFVALSPTELRLVEGNAEQTIPWDVVGAVVADEDRLEVVVARHDGPALVVQPRYGGLGLHGLEEAIRAAWNEARPKA